MRTAAEVKQYFQEHGVDLCGIAALDRFDDAPEGMRPRDVLPCVQSVIVIARRFPTGVLQCETAVPYTVVRNMLSDTLEKVTFEFCCALEREGVIAVPTGVIGPTEIDAHTGRRHGIVSAKHAAQAAGLGIIGRNTLLITPEYGNMVWLSAILCELKLEPDPPLENHCCEGCSLCVEACPAHALGEPQMNQNDCLRYAFGGENGGEWKIKCYRCREVCPYCLGTLNGNMRRPNRPVAPA